MKTTINTVKQILETMKRGLSSKGDVEQSDRFVFMDEKVTTFNDSMLFMASSPFGDDIEGAVVAKELLAYLGRYKVDHELVVKIDDDGSFCLKLNAKDRKTEVRLAFDEEVSMPIDEVGDLENLKWKYLPPDFSKGLGLIAPCASSNPSDNILQCVHLADGQLVSTDTFNISRYVFKKAKKKVKGKTHINTATALIFKNSALELARHDLEKFNFDNEGWLLFKTKDGMIIGARDFAYDDAEYPDLDGFFDEFEGEPLTLPDLSDPLINIKILLDGESNDQFDIESINDQIIMTAESSIGNSIKERLKAKGLPEFTMKASATQIDFLIKKAKGEIEFGEESARIKSDNVTYLSHLI